MMFDTEKFIYAVKCRPVIYNPKCDGYNSKEVKLTRWQEIATIMFPDWTQLPADKKEQKLKELYTKWKSIRDHFVKELRKSKSGHNKKKRKYIYHDDLKFLLPTMENKQLSQGVSDSENETPASLAVPDLETVNTMASCNITIGADVEDSVRTAYRGDEYSRPESNSSGTDNENYNGHNVADVSDLLEVQHVDASRFCATLPSEIVDTDTDVDALQDRMGNEAFLMSLLPLLNKLPHEYVMDVRIEMMQILQRYSTLNKNSDV